MKQILITIAALVLVGCGPPPPDISIHDAADEGNIKAVKQHLAAGTDVDARDGVGETPMHAATFYGHKEIVELLIAKGADVNAKNDGGMTPLHFATNEGYKETVELLIAAGADVNAKNDGGSTSLFYAAFKGHKEIVELLIAADADVNAKIEDSSTPLHLAAVQGHNEIVELLIAKSADVNAKIEDGGSYKGVTPLDLAISRKQTETTDLLRKHGGKTGAEFPVSKTVLSNPSSLSKEDSYRLSASEIEEISSKPHDTNWTVPKLSRFAFRPGLWERYRFNTTTYKKIKHVDGRNVVIETSRTPNGPKITTEIHSFDSTSNTMHSNFLIHNTGEVRRSTGAVNIEERTVNWTSQFKSNKAEKLIQNLKVTFDNNWQSAKLIGGISKNGKLVSTMMARLKWVGTLTSSAFTAEELKAEGK